MALRVLLDAHLPAALAELLRARGYDVVAAQAIPALRSLDDRSLLAEAAQLQRDLGARLLALEKLLASPEDGLRNLAVFLGP